MKLNSLSIVAIALLLLVGLFVLGYTGEGKRGTVASVQGTAELVDEPTSALSAPTVFYDFGTISMKDGNVTKEFELMNPTDEDILVSTVVTSCMCTAAFVVAPDGSIKGPFGMPGMGSVPPANELIPAGESRRIRVVYNPNAHGPAGVGRIDRFVTVTDASGDTVRFEIKALVTP